MKSRPCRHWCAGAAQRVVSVWEPKGGGSGITSSRNSRIFDPSTMKSGHPRRVRSVSSSLVCRMGVSTEGGLPVGGGSAQTGGLCVLGGSVCGEGVPALCCHMTVITSLRDGMGRSALTLSACTTVSPMVLFCGFIVLFTVLVVNKRTELYVLSSGGNKHVHVLVFLGREEQIETVSESHYRQC